LRPLLLIRIADRGHRFFVLSSNNHMFLVTIFFQDVFAVPSIRPGTSYRRTSRFVTVTTDVILRIHTLLFGVISQRPRVSCIDNRSCRFAFALSISLASPKRVVKACFPRGVNCADTVITCVRACLNLQHLCCESVRYRTTQMYCQVL
jgi:hypothetical protein